VPLNKYFAYFNDSEKEQKSADKKWVVNNY
jgi:hypothetical protein